MRQVLSIHICVELVAINPEASIVGGRNLDLYKFFHLDKFTPVHALEVVFFV